ncbi:hypothetical protein ABZ470_37045 [Streptosporangium sp. NPDC020072]|uniref:hypothetical protein n=1 Tax=Streptosporangium sp. NPDC020072 TaxID=3154788 RepID=UPI003443867E
MIPSYPIVVSAQIPEGASFWMPSKSEYDERAEGDGEGFGYFRDTWLLLELTTEEAAGLVAEERELLPLVDRYSSTPEEFEETVSSLEHPDLPEHQPDRLRDTPLWDHIVDPTGSSREHAFYSLEFGVAGLSYVLNSLGFLPVASCRVHYERSWSTSPVVFVATTQAGAQWLQPLLERTGCGFSIDPDRPQFLVIEAPSVTHSIALAEIIVEESPNAPQIHLAPDAETEGPEHEARREVPGQEQLW